MTLTTRALLAAALLVGVAPAVAQLPTDEAGRIASLWEQRRKAVSTAEYKLSWEWFPPNLTPGDPTPGENGIYTGKGTLLIDFVNNRIRFELEETHPDGKPLSTTRRWRQRRVFADDGLDQFYFDHCDRLPGLSEPAKTTHSHGQIGRPAFIPFDPYDSFDPILWAHGIVRTEKPSPGICQPMQWRPTAAMIQLIGWEEMGGKPYTTVRIPYGHDGKADLLSVDSGGTGTIVRRVRSDGGKSRCDISYHDTPYGSFPEGWKVNLGGLERPLALYRQVRVESATYNRPIPVDEFRITFPPGTPVTKPDGGYLAQQDGQLLRLPDRRPDDPPDDIPAWMMNLPRQWSKQLSIASQAADWWMAGALAPVVGLGILLVRLRRKRVRATVE